MNKRTRFISFIIVLFFIVQLGFVTIIACQSVGTYEADYQTPKTTFSQGEVVYGKETYDSEVTLMLRIRDPNNVVVFESDPHSTVITCSYKLKDDAPIGEWNIQVGIFNGGWCWLTGPGDISYFSVITQKSYTLSVNTSGNGTVQNNPDSSTYNNGTIVELTAIADLGWTFDHWSGNLTGNENPTDIIMTNNKTVKAHFTKNSYTLTIHIDGEGTVAKNLDQLTFSNGTLVTITAAASPGWIFSSWTGDVQSSSNIETINITKNTTITAHFIEESTTNGDTNHDGIPPTGNTGVMISGKNANEDDSENIPPIATITESDSNLGEVNSIMKFHGLLSYDPDGTISNWLWDFGDNTSLTGVTVNHRFTKPGLYIVRLTVIDNNGATNDTETSIQISKPNNPPSTPELFGPTEGIAYEYYSFTINSSDPDNDSIKYIIDLNDGSINESPWLLNNASYTIHHRWMSPGTYEITAMVSDNQTTSSSTFTIIIRATEVAQNTIPMLMIPLLGFLFVFLIAVIKRNKVKDILGLKK